MFIYLLFTSAVHVKVIEGDFDSLSGFANELVVTEDVIGVHAGVGRGEYCPQWQHVTVYLLPAYVSGGRRAYDVDS